MATAKTNRNKALRVGNHVRFPYGSREVEALVIEDRGNPGIGGRQIVRVRILGRETSSGPPPTPANFEEGSFEVPAEEVTLIK